MKRLVSLLEGQFAKSSRLEAAVLRDLKVMDIDNEG